MVPALRGVSSAAKPYETPFSGLHEGSAQSLPRQIELADHLAVDLDRAL